MSASSDAVTPRARVSPYLAAWALALLLGLQPIASDVYLPALPLLTRELGASMSASQQTIAALILGFGAAQLVWGPLADRYGRRPVLLTGLAVFTASSIGCALAADIGWLVAWRVVQGVCLASAVVVARAMVRDLYAPAEGARVMSLGLSGLGLIALAGPALGGYVATLWGWRAPLVVVAASGLVVLAFVAASLPETLLRPNPDAMRLAPLMAAWKRIASHRGFIAWTALIVCTYGGLFTMLAGSSFVYMTVLGLSPSQYGLVLASCSLTYIAGTFQCRRWLLAHGMAGAVRRASGFTIAAGIFTVVPALAGVQSVWALLPPFWLYAFGHGTHQPIGQAGVVGPFPQHAGTASALAGFAMAAVAYAVGLWLGRALTEGVLPFALTIGMWSLLLTVVAWTLVGAAEKP